MNWVSSLCALYDANAERAGQAERWKKKTLVLFPVGYDTMEAQIEVHIDQEENYLGAHLLEKDEAETLVPYPEGRTSGIKALPLFDSLSYVADDLLEAVTFYFPDAKNEKETGYNEALSIGYVASQKAHNALKWIIRRQGFSRDGVCIVAWENALRDLPDFYASAADILSQVPENAKDGVEVELEEEVLFEDDEAEVP
ncbi:type I-C CRISPR-associated protein Cas8c/Csd1 [Desulfotomaculum sp. 1211_IL3151]|uniref:type I-C CRISPR-associated protein Cas8c/Csd1 n=1 Tax=Desulfotomaculum sp. 1211_IL3151 TaxID=3084055 RepID=UPI002FD8B07C